MLKTKQIAGKYKQTQDTTYNVSTTGNDTNDGITAPFATINGALNYINSSVDLNGFSATVQVADGSYSGGIKCPEGLKNVTVQGNLANSNSVEVVGSNNNSIIEITNYSWLNIKSLKLTPSANSTIGIVMQNFSQSYCENIRLGGNLSFGFYVYQNSYCRLDGSLILGGNISNSLFYSVYLSTCQVLAAVYCYTYSIFYVANVSRSSVFICNFSQTTFSGSPSGCKGIASRNGIIEGVGTKAPTSMTDVILSSGGASY